MSFSEFISMGGYGEFVWSAYGFTFLVLAINVIVAVRKLKKAKTRQNQISD